MTYIELINRFWDSYRVKKFSDIDTAIYFFLLNECNIRRWLNPFELQTRNIELCFSISRKTIGEARNRLKQRGVIDFIEAQGRGPTVYLISDVEVTNELLLPMFCVSNSVSSQKHEGNTTGNTRVTQRLHKGNTTPNSTLLYEDIRLKTKDYSNSASIVVSAQPELSLFADGVKKSTRRKTNTKKATPPAPPTLEQIRQYFLAVDADNRLENWEASAALFFDTFNADGWVNKRGRSVVERTKWESEANKWIFYREEQEKKTKPNEIRQVDKFSERRGSEPGTTSRKGFKGSF